MRERNGGFSNLVSIANECAFILTIDGVEVIGSLPEGCIADASQANCSPHWAIEYAEPDLVTISSDSSTVNCRSDSLSIVIPG